MNERTTLSGDAYFYIATNILIAGTIVWAALAIVQAGLRIYDYYKVPEQSVIMKVEIKESN